MSVNNETSHPTPRVLISVTETPPPQWSGRVFQCEQCGQWWQLEAGDQCEELFVEKTDVQVFKTPPCWRCDCVNSIEVPRS